MLPGVSLAKKKDGTAYYRSSITRKNKHISLGSFDNPEDAHAAYQEAERIMDGEGTLDGLLEASAAEPPERAWAEGSLCVKRLVFDKCVILLNYRDNGMYLSNPIYVRKNYFSYYLSAEDELKFDKDDLFYYGQHRIMRRKGHLFVNDYGMQVTIMSRFGLKSHAVCGRDYVFANGDSTDLRYSNVIVINKYHGVAVYYQGGKKRYRVRIHTKGNYTVGSYSSEEMAAVAYNKAVDLAKNHGIVRNFPQNYIENLSAREYVDLYENVKISSKYMDYLKGKR